MKLPTRAFVLLIAILFGGVAAAKADGTSLLLFQLSGPVDATFELNVNPAVDPGNADMGFGFTITPLDLKINGVLSSDVLSFYNSSPITGGGGGFGAFANSGLDDFATFGQQLYTGLETAPSFASIINETITLGDFDANVSDAYTLKVTRVVESTPEPPTLLLLAAALLPLGLAAKRLL
jgi:hypothetical protein